MAIRGGFLVITNGCVWFKWRRFRMSEQRPEKPRSSLRQPEWGQYVWRLEAELKEARAQLELERKHVEAAEQTILDQADLLARAYTQGGSV